MSNKLVALTGVSGYVAGNILLNLLKKGYQVNGTVRSLKNKDKVAHLLSIADTDEIKKAGGKLTLFEADLEKQGSFKAAFKGVQCVFHTASPFHFNFKDADELIKPAVNGTKNVLQEAHDAKTVKRVVMTSSIVAMSSKNHSKDHVLSEKDWNDLTRENVKGKGDAYFFSKTKAEQIAWELVKQWKKTEKNTMYDLVTINPCFVFGPPKSSRGDSTSMKYILGYFNGSQKEIEESTLNFIDVRDVASAHVLAYENPNASGRYLLTQSPSVKKSEMLAIIEKHFGDKFVIPKLKQVDGVKLKRPDNSKAKKLLGRDLISIEDCLKDTINALIKFGFTENIKK